MNNSSNYKIYIFMFLLLIITGCGNKKVDNTEQESIIYTEFGPTKLVDEEEQDNKEFIYKLQDVEYEFGYTCKSEKLDLDRKIYFRNSEVNCSFYDDYVSYLFNKVSSDDLIKNNDLRLDSSDLYSIYKESKSVIFNLYTSNFDLEDVYISLLEKFEELDNRGYIKYFQFDIIDRKTDTKIGNINSKDKKLVSKAEENSQWFVEYANRTFSTSGKSDAGEIELVRIEENVLIKSRKDMYNNIYRKTSIEHDEELESALTNIYYFYDNIAHEEFYMIDYYVLGQGCYYNTHKSPIRNKYSKSMCENWWK